MEQQPSTLNISSILKYVCLVWKFKKHVDLSNYNQ